MKFKSFSLFINKLCLVILFFVVFVIPASAKDKTSAYLFTYFTGNRVEEEQICFALSYDGYNYKALNGGKPVINSKDISLTGGVRDPHILRAEDGKTFYMVVTDMTSNKGWDSNRGMVLLKSTDLIKWTSTAINIPTVFSEFADIDRVWAPQTIYDPLVGKYMVYFSMKRKGPGNFDIIYYSYANKDFTALETAPKQLFFHPEGKSCIDGDIVFNDGKYNLFFKTEGHGNGIKKAIAEKLTGNWKMIDKYYQQTTKAVEGAGVFKLNNSNEWILMYDVYSSGYYEFTKSTDLENFSLIQDKISMNFHPRHGTVLPVSNKEADRLLKKWQPIDEVLRSAQSISVKTININIDSKNKTIFLPVKPGTDLTKLKPEFKENKNIKIKPANAVDFTKGAIKYKFCVAGRKPETYYISAGEMHNPALTGLYADPDIIYSNKTGKYYIYPTSDGFDGWSGIYFKVFSSPDMVNWTDEGKIITLGENVKWADRNAWAPTIAEKKINGQYQYFYYFTAAQKIGVAVSDNPTGPFTDIGKPLIDTRPNGVTRGQVIDPDVFTDPVSGKSYLYWGNGFAAGAELNDDMVSINSETVKTLKVPGSFREGSHVLYREGKYYYMWSIDDTRSPDYAVGYAFMSSPLGELTVPENNVILRKDESKGIFGTGHHSTIQIGRKDEWYIIYHRFNYPNGINMGGSAGFNREVCIDKMYFNPDGTIKPVVPTLEGIDPVGGK
jgi:hypothetical protein